MAGESSLDCVSLVWVWACSLGLVPPASSDCFLDLSACFACCGRGVLWEVLDCWGTGPRGDGWGNVCDDWGEELREEETHWRVDLVLGTSWEEVEEVEDVLEVLLATPLDLFAPVPKTDSLSGGDGDLWEVDVSSSSIIRTKSDSSSSDPSGLGESSWP